MSRRPDLLWPMIRCLAIGSHAEHTLKDCDAGLSLWLCAIAQSQRFFSLLAWVENWHWKNERRCRRPGRDASHDHVECSRAE